MATAALPFQRADRPAPRVSKSRSEMLSRSLRYAWNHPLASKDRLGMVRRMASWQLRSAFSRGPHVCDWVNGTKLVVSRGQSGLTGNLYFGLHEFCEMAFFAHFLRPEDVFADIGANAGSFTVLAGAVAGAKVYAFEPGEQALEGLARNIAANDLDSTVEVYPVALGRADGQSLFTTGKGPTNRIVDEQQTGTRLVEVRETDSMLAGKGVTAIKIDVERSEHLVIGGAKKLLVEPQLAAMSVETPMKAVDTALQSAGFERLWYNPYERRLTDRPNGLRVKNHLYIRERALVEQRLRTAAPLTFGELSV
ncbi:FkbM family methyltransferase [Aurantiacibacter sp. MUD61]|uniref:FkbM family methyltransferase n=1 Tax=Aurantiacibacter sp. MUD61 TaxID=3009083 RepID=UPI0022F0F0B6|nr:FkbM family methyltransferase [Aurantiacibacter sp. MUD61]